MTAGAYVLTGGRFVFMVGPTKPGDKLGVVRLGGHCEAHETFWDCAAREVFEEAALRIRPLSPPATYQFEDGQSDERLTPTPWLAESPEAVPPLLVLDRRAANPPALSVMFLVSAGGTPIPSAETQGLLLLSPDEVFRLVYTPSTLDQYLQAGGQALLRADLPTHLPLEPFIQLRLLATLLEWHPQIVTAEHH
jgi:8-oxo-dGTP pyrophosphatase MutT (NUDIX family)